MDEKLFLYIDILGFSDIVENGHRINALFAEIDRLNVHTDNGFRTIVFSDTILVYANDGWMGSIEGQRSAVMWLVEFAQDLFYRLLHLGMHFRAYLTRGDFFHSKREHFESFHGKALVDCYVKEKTIQAMGVFMANSLVPLSHVFHVTPYDNECSFVHVMQTLDNVSFKGEAYPLDPILVQGMDLEWQLAEDVLYLRNIHRHMNDGALPESVRGKYAATWALIESRHATLLEVLVASGFNPAAIGASPEWPRAIARAADPKL
jgi:hypothetical protein